MRNLEGVAAVVVGTVMVLVLAGCTGGGPSVGSSGPPESSGRPVVTASVAPVPSVTPTVSEEERLLAMIPEEAKGDDLLAAVAMAKFFVTLIPSIFVQDRDTAMFDYLFVDTCEFCSSVRGTSDDLVNSGGYQVGGVMTPAESTTAMVLTEDGQTAYASFLVSESPVVQYDGEGQRINETDTRGHEFYVKLVLGSGGWRVAGVDHDYR